jgi:hypothetical protein
LLLGFSIQAYAQVTVNKIGTHIYVSQRGVGPGLYGQLPDKIGVMVYLVAGLIPIKEKFAFVGPEAAGLGLGF